MLHIFIKLKCNGKVLLSSWNWGWECWNWHDHFCSTKTAGDNQTTSVRNIELTMSNAWSIKTKIIGNVRTSAAVWEFHKLWLFFLILEWIFQFLRMPNKILSYRNMFSALFEAMEIKIWVKNFRNNNFWIRKFIMPKSSHISNKILTLLLPWEFHPPTLPKDTFRSCKFSYNMCCTS